MAKVYKARYVKTGKTVAVKIISKRKLRKQLIHINN